MSEPPYDNVKSTPTQLRGVELSDTFRQLDSLLVRYQGLWRIQPMSAVAGLDAEANQPALRSILRAAMPDDDATVALLAEAVGGLSLPQIESIDASVAAQYEFFTPLLPEATTLNWLIEPCMPNPLLAEQRFPFWLTNGIGGRKLGQIKRFVAHLPVVRGTMLEWCAGKGHLGRLLCHLSQAAPLNVVSLEWQSALCASGTQLAQQFELAQTFQHTDVLTDAGRQALAECDHAMALHACGDLHRNLLEQASLAQLKGVWLAPCCYHLTAETTYQPLSKRAAGSKLVLSRQELKLAVQGQVTAGERVRFLRETEVTWRLAYQILRERYANAADYRALPSVPKHWFSGRFSDFAVWASEHHQWNLPANVDWQSALKAAQQRYLLLKRVDLIRHVFRRPLELWLVMDRALFLQQQNYDVSVQAFCDYQLTPRNLLISAQWNAN